MPLVEGMLFGVSSLYLFRIISMMNYVSRFS